MAKRERLTADEIGVEVRAVPEWSVVAGKLHRELTFPDFSAAFGFMTRVALAAEKQDHHPDWTNVYDRVTIDLHTHDLGGLSAADFRLAATIDRLLGE